MGIIVKLLGSGLGFASEAIHAARSRSPSAQPSSSSSSAVARSASPLPRSTPVINAPPEYVEVADEAAAEKLIRSGRAERVTDYPFADEKKKATEAGYHDYDDNEEDDSESGESDLDAFGQDAAAWELDDMAERVAAPPPYDEDKSVASGGPAASPTDSEEVKVKKEEAMVREMVRMAGPPPQPVRRIPCPVIIPQRRPRQKDRGFVRAYAPVLADCGVGQEVFLKFLSDWHQASKASPWIDVVFVAAGVVGFVPEVAAQVVSTVVQVVAGTARELQSRQRRNTFLDRVNDDLLMPRGLYAMVMAFKDEVPGQQAGGPLSRLAGTLGKTLFASQKLDINQTVAKYSNPDPNMSKLKKGLKDIRLTSGQTHGEVELPEAAALVFPDLDRVAKDDLGNQESNGKGSENKGIADKWKSAGTWVQDYLDRRAQAFYEAEHPGTSLVVPSASRAPLVSRFNDPNHPANSGSLISLLTGGVLNSGNRRKERRAAKQERRAIRREYKDARRVSRGRSPRGPRKVRPPKGQRKGIIKKILQQDVLYLLVVNLPTQEEVQESVARLERIITQGGVAST